MKYTVLVQVEADSAFEAWGSVAAALPETLAKPDVEHAINHGISELKVFSKDDRGMVHWRAEPDSDFEQVAK